MTDGEGVVRFANPAAERLLGRELHELVGRRAPFAVAPCDAQEVEIPVPDGTRLIVEARVTETTWEGTGALLATLHDLTDRRRLENELRQSQKMEAIGQLAGGVAHDFNNLLTAISGYTELLLLKLRDGDPGRRDAEEVRRAAQRAATLTQQLLAFSRRQMLRPRPLDLNAVIDGMDAMLRRLIGEHIELVSVPAQDLGQVSADPGQLEQVMLNLAVNARDAMPDGGKLVLETAKVTLDKSQARRHGVEPGEYVVLAVSDTGCGMDDETRARIFEPFFTTKEQGKGTGLGLATVYGIVTQSGGAVGVESAPGAGSRFTVLLPRLAVELPAPAPEPTGTTEALRGTETVLLVEDEDIVRRLAHRVLSEHGYTVLEASYGDEAIQIAARHAGRIHLLVTDVVMPQMSGRELAAAVVRLRPDTRVLYMSGYTDSVFGSAGILDDRTWFLAKPFTPLALARKAREVLDAGSDAPAAFPEPGMGGAQERGLSGALEPCRIPAVGSLDTTRT
ncbi:MAG: ATP-binding protein [Thermoleophilia bacterium]